MTSSAGDTSSGVSQTSPWLAVVQCINATATSGGIGFANILTVVTYIPKF